MKNTKVQTISLLSGALLTALMSAPTYAQQLEVTPTSDADLLRDALVGASSGQAISIQSAAFEGAQGAAATYRNGPLSIGDGILLTSGKAELALPPNSSTEAGFDQERAGSELCESLTAPHKSQDVARLSLSFTLNSPFTGISFQSIFGSEEYPEYLGQTYNDAYGVFLDGKQIAFDEDGDPITINGPFFASKSVVTDTQTEYDGSTSILTTRASAEPGVHTLDIIICDAGDGVLDSGVFLTNLNGCIGENCDSTVPCEQVDNDNDGVNSCTDCNDGDAAIYPGAAETCDEIDNNCDGQVDEGGVCCADEDEDGVCDQDDLCPGSDDAQDKDEDSIPDGCDNCPDEANADQVDSDNDGTGDACEPVAPCNDHDNDGVPNPEDTCENTPEGTPVNDEGCSVAQSCPCDGSWCDNQHYQQCVKDAADELLASGAITPVRHQVFIEDAAHAKCAQAMTPHWSWWFKLLLRFRWRH